MHSLSKITSRYWYRSRLFWALVVVALYAIIGFLVLPGIIKNTAIEQIEQNLGWQASIEKVELNPFTLTLTIHQLSVVDEQGETMLSFDRYHNDIELRSLTEGAVTFANLELISPYIKLVVGANGKTNFQDAIESHQSSEPANVEPDTSAKSAPPKLLFDAIKVEHGAVDVADYSQAEAIEHQLKPISFSLQNFSTFVNESGAYQLEIALGTGQRLAWKGNIGIAPFHSSGFLKVENINAHRLWIYAQEHLPYSLTNALLGVEGSYEVSMAGSSPQLDISNATVTLDDVQVATDKHTDAFLGIDKITIGPLDFNLAKQKLDISRLAVDALALNIDRGTDGTLALLSPLTQTNNKSGSGNSQDDNPNSNTNQTNNQDNNPISNSDSQQSVTNGSDQTPPFQWAIGELLVNKGQLNIADQQPTSPANIVISDINTQVTGLSQDLSKSLDFGLSYFIQHSGKSEITGQVVPVPLNISAALNIDDIALATIQPYLNDHLRMTIEEGRLSVNGNLTLAAKSESDALDGGFKGAININQFNTTDQTVNERLVGWQSLAVDPITINFNPLAIDIRDIRFEEPYGRIIVTEDRSTNIAQLMVTPAPAAEAAKTTETAANTPKESNQPPAKPVPVKIDRILFNKGAAYFADLSLQPQFGTSIQNISGEVSGLSSDNLERANVDIKGTIEDYGKLQVKGKINPLSGDLYTDLAVTFDNIELSTMTPYSGRYVGYGIDKGKLDLLLNYKIANRVLDGDNRLVIDQFELGRTIESEEAVSLPLELALAILKDRNGVIDIDLPTHGNMDDPDFKISGLVLQALMNVINKAATAPFAMIGKLVGGDADELSAVVFAPGDAQLNPEQVTKLSKLSEALKGRPQLMLEIRASVDREVDGTALKKQKLDSRLPPQDSPQRLVNLETMLSNRSGTEALNQIKTASLPVPANADQSTPEAIDTAKYEQALYAALLKTERLTNLELTALAKQRVSSIKNQLVEQNSVDSEQVFALQPSLEGQSEKSGIATRFSLTAR